MCVSVQDSHCRIVGSGCVCVGETGNSRSENGSLVTNWVCVPRHFDEMSFLTLVAGWPGLEPCVRGQDRLVPAPLL